MTFLGADGFISLSTFQPAPTDPSDGFWRVFVKYGKLAPEFHGSAVFKRPQVMLEAGACFHTRHRPKPFYGGAIGPERLLSDDARSALAAVDVHPVQASLCSGRAHDVAKLKPPAMSSRQVSLQGA